METPISSTSSSRPTTWLAAGLFALLATVLLAGLGVAARQLEGEDFIGTRVANLQGIRSGQAVVSGASISRHIELSSLCLDGANLWEPRQDIFEIAAFQRHLESRGVVPSLWIMGYFPGLTTVDKGADGARHSDRRAIVYRTLQGSGDYRLIGGDWQGALRSIVAPALGYDDWRNRFNAAVQGRPFGARQPAPDTPQLDPEVRESQARQWAETAAAERSRVQFHDDGIAARAAAEFLEMNRALQAQDVPLVIVEMPVSPEMKRYRYGVSEADIAREELLLERLEEQGATYIRLSDLPPQPVGRLRDFMHMTQSGGRQFSRELGEELARRGIIERPACTGVQAGLPTIG